MYHKYSILDRKLRPGSYRPNIQSDEAQYKAEQDKLKGKQSIYNENEDRVRRCYDPTDEEKMTGEQSTYQTYQDLVAVKEQQRREEDAERKRVVETDFGYRNYTGGMLPWQERANPFSGSEEYERYLKREYLRSMLDENLRAEHERKAYGSYLKEADKEEDKYLLAQKNFWNKDLDKDKWWYKAGNGYHRGAGAAAPEVSHHIQHFQYNDHLDTPKVTPATTYTYTSTATWSDPKAVAEAAARPQTAGPTYPWAVGGTFE